MPGDSQRRLTKAQRTAIGDDCLAGLLGRNAIARKHDVSLKTVSTIAGEVGATFDRTKSAAATAAAQWDWAQWRQNMARRAASRAEWCDDRMDTADGGRDVQGYAVSLGIMVDKVGVLVPPDNPHADAQGLLGALAEELGVDGS